MQTKARWDRGSETDVLEEVGEFFEPSAIYGGVKPKEVTNEVKTLFLLVVRTNGIFLLRTRTEIQKYSTSHK